MTAHNSDLFGISGRVLAKSTARTRTGKKRALQSGVGMGETTLQRTFYLVYLVLGEQSRNMSVKEPLCEMQNLSPKS